MNTITFFLANNRSCSQKIPKWSQAIEKRRKKMESYPEPIKCSYTL